MTTKLYEYKFRMWVQQTWYAHLDELEAWGCKETGSRDLTEYYSRYKWWLRREYRHYQQTTRATLGAFGK